MIFHHVKNTKHIIVKLLAVLLVFHGGYSVPQAHAATFVWEQTLYGSGVLSTVDITATGLTFNGGTYAHIFTIANPADAYSSATFVQRVSGNLTLTTGDLSPSTRYFVTRGTIANTGSHVAQQHMSQMQANNVGTAYPYASGGFYGFVYFETNAASEIECWDTTLGAPAPTYPFQDCDNTFAPAGPGPYTPPSFNLVGTTSDFIASVRGSLTDGVQHTGQSIWPLFTFVGVLLAFIIALQLLVFTKRATGVSNATLGTKKRTRRRKNAYDDPLHPDHVAFERGKRANKADGINLFPDD